VRSRRPGPPFRGAHVAEGIFRQPEDPRFIRTTRLCEGALNGEYPKLRVEAECAHAER